MLNVIMRLYFIFKLHMTLYIFKFISNLALHSLITSIQLLNVEIFLILIVCLFEIMMIFYIAG